MVSNLGRRFRNGRPPTLVDRDGAEDRGAWQHRHRSKRAQPT
jgi:hypothetical protein